MHVYLLNLSIITISGINLSPWELCSCMTKMLYLRLQPVFSVVLLLRVLICILFTRCCAVSVSPQGSLNFHLILRERFKIFHRPRALKWHLSLLDYTVMRGMGTSGNVEYRCWPSYSQQGCVLSVHSAREAAHICNSHSQCSSFTLTGQKTWTG